MNSRKTYDYCIVGQGIAGSLLAWLLLKTGKDVLIIDNHFQGASSDLAAGIVNPITGRNYVRSWRVHEFLPVAKRMYKEIALDLGLPVHIENNMLRCLYTVEDENNWLARTQDDAISHFMLSEADYSEYRDKVVHPLSYGELTGTFQVRMGDIIHRFRKKWKEEKRYIQEKFIYESLNHQGGIFQYDSLSFHHIIFCEGYQAIHNPFFRDFGMRPSKGEVLFVRIPGAPFTKMYKDGIFIVHHQDDIYWIGGGYENNPIDENPSANGYHKLSEEVKRILKVDYEILDHKAAIRPTMASRRPILLRHPVHSKMYLFNGLGTKGASMAPYFSQQLVRHLLSGDEKDLVIESA